jgi:hypothetical protein
LSSPLFANVIFGAPETNNPEPILLSEEINPQQDFAPTTTTSQSTENKEPTANDSNAPTQLFVTSPQGSESSGAVDFTIERTGDLDKYVWVSYQTQDGTGKAGDRYLPIAGKALFAPGETEKTVSVQIPNDEIYTGNRQFGLVVKLLDEGLDPRVGGQELSLSVKSNGSQIRRWNYFDKEVANNLMGGVVNFSAAASNGQVDFLLNTDGVREYNDFFMYNPVTGGYESLMFDAITGATFSYAESERAPQGIQLQLVDGDLGDADGVSNGLIQTNGFLGRTTPGLITIDHGVFWAPTSADGQIQLRLINSPYQDYEMGWIAVDDLDGSIDGLRPDDVGYESAAFARRQIIFNNQKSASSQALSRNSAQMSFTNSDLLATTESQFFGHLSQSSLQANRYYILYTQEADETTFSIKILLLSKLIVAAIIN